MVMINIVKLTCRFLVNITLLPAKGTFWVYSPFTNGQVGECRSCSDHGSSVGSQQTRQTLHVKHMARSSPVDPG